MFINVQCSLVRSQRLLVRNRLLIKLPEIDKGVSGVGVVWAKGLLSYGKRALKQLLRLAVIAQGVGEPRELDEGTRKPDAVAAKRLFRNRQPPLVERLGLRIPALLLVEGCDILASVANQRVLMPQ